MEKLLERRKTTRDLTGCRFGRLLVKEFAGYIERRTPTWLCLCDCGTEKVLRSTSLLTTKQATRSCGCLLREHGSIKVKKLNEKFANRQPGETAFIGLYNTYNNNARYRGYEFCLSKQQALELFKQNCYYCGVEPKQGANLQETTGVNGNFLFNGIDRVDNTKGYYVENCVTCCGMCNKMKSTYSTTEFREHIQKIYNHLCQDSIVTQ